MLKKTNEWNADPYLDEAMTDTETFSYAHYDGPKQVMVQAVYVVQAESPGETSPCCTQIHKRLN